MAATLKLEIVTPEEKIYSDLYLLFKENHQPKALEKARYDWSNARRSWQRSHPDSVPAL